MKLGNMMKTLEIFSKYGGDSIEAFSRADHEVLWSNHGTDIPTDSDDGKELLKLGWEWDKYSQVYYLHIG